MTTGSTAVPLPGAITFPGAVPFTGAGTLLRFAVRRDRRRLLIWVVSLAGVTVYGTTALGAVYPTAASRQARAAVTGTPTGTLLGGPGYGLDHYTLGAMIANELGLSVMVAIAILSIQVVVRHTRAEEEGGGAELILTGAVGRRAPLTMALALAVLVDLAVAVVVAAGLAGAGLGFVDSVAVALGWALTGLVFAGVAAVTAQLFESARGATGAALAVLGVAVVVRGVGDVLHSGGSALSWLSPIAWAQQTRAFVDLRWTPLLLSVAATGALVAAAYRIGRHRDVGAGVLVPRRGPASASPSLAGPASLLGRLQRGSMIGWTVALFLFGATFGSLTDSVVAMVRQTPLLAKIFAASGASVTDSFTAATSVDFGLCAAAFAVASVLRLRNEESAGRLELLLATPVDRRRLLAAGATVSALGAAVLLLSAGLGDGLSAAAVTGDAGLIGRDVGAALVHFPAVLVMAGIAALLVAMVPRMAVLAWLVVVWAFLAGMFGALLNLPPWTLKLSPFGWTPKVPAEHADIASLAALLIVAAALLIAALATFRRRDVPA
jgi:ABC-2 type transport system permease protein